VIETPLPSRATASSLAASTTLAVLGVEIDGMNHALGSGRSEVVLSILCAPFRHRWLWQQNASNAVEDFNSPDNEASRKPGSPRAGTPLLISGRYG